MFLWEGTFARTSINNKNIARKYKETARPSMIRMLTSWANNHQQIPHAWHDSGKLGHRESWHASMLYMSFRTTTANLAVEEMTSHDRSDMVLLHGDQVFVFEFKMVKGKKNMERKTRECLDRAIEQMRAKKHAEKYLDRGKPIHLIGMAFGEKARNLLDIRVERL